MRRTVTALGIRSDEKTLAGWMAILFAVTQASHGVAANAADALFFLRFGVDDLPLMILLSGPAVMAAVIGFSAGLARRGARRWLTPVMITTSVWAGALWVSVFSGGESVYALIWISTQVIIFVTLGVIWSAAGNACNTRQAKRLFPFFASAAVAGGVVGNLMVGPLASSLGTENLLLVQALLLLGASLTLRRVSTFFEAAADGGGSVVAEMRQAIQSIRTSRLLQLAALAILLLSALFYLVFFPFSEEVTRTFSTEAEIAGFLGVFSSAATFATFLFSMFVTRRMFSRFGVVFTLLTVPVVYLLGFSAWIIAFGLVTATIVRGAQWIAVNAVQFTAYNTLFNVLPTAKRGSVMALMTAVPAQLGTMAAGSILLFEPGGSSPTMIILFGIGLAAACVAVVVVMRPAYLNAVVTAVRRGLADLWELPNPGIGAPLDRDVVRVLESHLDDPRPGARAAAAAGLAHAAAGSTAAEVAGLLEDDDPAVRAAAFGSICRIDVDTVAPHLSTALRDQSPAVRRLAIGYAAGSRLELDPSLVEELLIDTDFEVRAVAAWLVGGDRGRESVEQMIALGDPEAVRSVLTEASRHDRDTLGVDPSPFLDHDDATVRAAAVTVLGTSGGDVSLALALLDDRSVRVRHAAAESLAVTPAGRSLLIDTLNEGSVSASEAALRALTPNEMPERAFTEWAAGEARRAAFLAGHVRVLRPRAVSASARYLVETLGSRVERLIGWVLMAMTTESNSETMTAVGRGVRSDDAETKAQAVEALDSMGDHTVMSVLLPLLEPASSNGDGGLLRPSLDSLVSDFDPWLKTLANRWLQEEDGQPTEEAPNGPPVAGLGEMNEEPAGALDELDRMLMLQRVTMFSQLDPEDLVSIARATREVRFDSGDLVYKEGEPGDQLLVIVDGTAVVSRTRDRSLRVIQTYTGGDHVGELSLLTGGSRSADIHAGEEGLSGLVVTKSELMAILEERPAVARDMLSTLAGRLIDQT